jgi:acetyltransferase-like isoleucine patch superfamily enzyme
MISPHAVVQATDLPDDVVIHEFAVVRQGAKLGKGVVVQPHAHISPGAQLGANVHVGPGAVINDHVTVGNDSFIGPGCILGEPVGSYYRTPPAHEPQPTVIGAGAVLRSYTTIYEDVHIGQRFQTGHHAVIREDTEIGDGSSFGSFSETPGRSRIGNYVRVHSKVMLSEHNVIEDYVWIFPFVVLTNTRYPPVGPAVQTTIKAYAQIFSHATLLPGLTVGENAIVGAGALVTRDVGDERLVIGSPARDIGSVRDVRDEQGKPVYPWRDHLATDRGYPWQRADT